jgi:HD-GYP domain-containing protein (c-di-GMP phosphodiesterase class II)
MIRLPVEELTVGMELAAPIPHPRLPHVALLKTGYRLISKVLRQLPRYGVRYVWIRHPGFEFLDDKVGQIIPQNRTQIFYEVKKSFTGIADRTAGAFNLNEYKRVVTELIVNLATEKNAVWAERLLGDNEELFAHSANVTYLALVLGMGLRQYIALERKYVERAEIDDLTNLGIGAMLHDIGKLGMDRDLRQTHELDLAEANDVYQQHPERGYRALTGHIEATAAAVVLHHHQRFDGQGFPKPWSAHAERKLPTVKGRKIHIFPRIVAVANAVDSLITIGRRNGKPTIAALHTLLSSDVRPRFDPVVLLAALRCIPPFALGSCVTLSDGRKAIVVDLNSESPCQPAVQVVPEGCAMDAPTGDTIDLSTTSDLCISNDGGCEVRQYFYTLPKRRKRREPVTRNEMSLSRDPQP